MVAVDSVDAHSHKISDDAYMLRIPSNAVTVETMEQRR